MGLKEKLRDLVTYWGWDDTLGALSVFFGTLGLFLGLLCLCVDHRIQRYVVGAEGAHGMVCAVAERNWWTNDIVFCTENAARVLQFVTFANESLMLQQSPAKSQSFEPSLQLAHPQGQQ